MSRVGKHSIAIPSGVTCQMSEKEISVKGKLGVLNLALTRDVVITQDGSALTVVPANDSKQSRMSWGTYRNIISNMVTGVDKGFTLNLEINGVGYRAAVQGKELVLQLGYSHEIKYPIPTGIEIKCEKPTAISITGADRQRVGQVAAEIRSYRKPEPYKGKGIKLENEYIVRKEGKKK